MKVLVSGASGQDGSYMCEFLLKYTDHEVLAAMRRTSQAILSNLKNCIGNPRFRIVSLDLLDVHSITELIKTEKPDYFINFGAATFVFDSWIQPALTLMLNSVSLIHILEAVKSYAPNCRVYSSGSSEQWGDVKYSPQDEKHPMSPRSIYGVSKCTASHICKVYRESFGLYVIHGILTNHESPRRQSYFITRKITEGVARISKHIKSGDGCFSPIYCGNLTARRDWSHAQDFVQGIWSMMNQDQIREDFVQTDDKFLFVKQLKEYVLSSNETYSVKQLIELAFSKADIYGTWKFWKGIEAPENEIYVTDAGLILVAVDPKFYRPAEVELLLGDSSEIRKNLGWKPEYSFDRLIEEMVQNDLDLLK